MKDGKRTLMNELELYVQYAVEEKDLTLARGVIDSYNDNERILRLLNKHYSELPEAREEPVHKLTCLMERAGVALFVVVCSSHSYLYVVSMEEVLLLSEYQKEVPAEVPAFFGYSSEAEFLQDCLAVEDLVAYPITGYVASVCPACGVSDGEEHLLGCVVEVCPWCEGTLNNCNCRFEQLGVEEVENEEQLERFSELLRAKGRIPYSGKEKVAYPGTSKGLDV